MPSRNTHTSLRVERAHRRHHDLATSAITHKSRKFQKTNYYNLFVQILVRHIYKSVHVLEGMHVCVCLLQISTWVNDRRPQKWLPSCKGIQVVKACASPWGEKCKEKSDAAHIDIPGRSDKSLAYKRKMKTPQHSLPLLRYAWQNDASTALTRLKDKFSWDRQSRPLCRQ